MASEEEVVILARLAGTRQFIVNAEEMGVAVEELGLKTKVAGVEMATTARRGYLMNQALFTTRRLMYGVTLATIAGGVAAFRWGWQFNSAMQQARVALKPVAGDIGGVQNRLNKLYNFTKYTPFQFKDVTIAFRQMYFGMRTLGISADTVQMTLKSITDALSATGRTTPGALNRVAVALQHMAYQGVLTGQAINQLNRDGIPATAILRREFGLTGDQIHNIRQQGIPTLVFLQRLNKYIESQPGLVNAAYRQATQTLHGQFTTFKDNVSQLFGAIETGFFKRFQGRLTSMNEWFNHFGTVVRKGNMDDIVKAIDPHALALWHQLSYDIMAVWKAIKILIGDLAHSGYLWGTIYLILVAVHVALAALLPFMHGLAFVLQILIPLYVAWYTYQKLNVLWLGITKFTEGALTKQTKDLTFAQMLYRLWLQRTVVTEKIATAAMWLFVTAQNATVDAFIAQRIAAAAFFDALLLTMGPAGWIILGITLIVAGLVILYVKWKAFHDAVNRTVSFLWHHPLVGMITPLIGPLVMVAHLFESIYHSVIALYNLARHPIKGLEGIGGGGPWWKKALNFVNPLHGLGIPGLASGGTVMRSGFTMVGESGPELLSLPQGAQVAPLSASRYNPIGGGSGFVQPLIIQLLMPNKRVLAEAYAEVSLDAAARA